MTQETTAQKIKNQLKTSTENDKIEKLKENQCMNNSAGTLKDHQYTKKNPWHGYVTQV
jgi:hypothetical protein